MLPLHGSTHSNCLFDSIIYQTQKLVKILLPLIYKAKEHKVHKK